jgi:hypothetical protein
MAAAQTDISLENVVMAMEYPGSLARLAAPLWRCPPNRTLAADFSVPPCPA